MSEIDEGTVVELTRWMEDDEDGVCIVNAWHTLHQCRDAFATLRAYVGD